MEFQFWPFVAGAAFIVGRVIILARERNPITLLSILATFVAPLIASAIWQAFETWPSGSIGSGILAVVICITVGSVGDLVIHAISRRQPAP